MSIECNKVTWYSKLLALVLFVALPFIGFYLGMKYAEQRAEILKWRDFAKEQRENLQNSLSTEVDTTGWKTYRNEEYGFEFMYPNDWELTLRGEAGYILELITSVSKTEQGPNYHSIGFSVMEIVKTTRDQFLIEATKKLQKNKELLATCGGCDPDILYDLVPIDFLGFEAVSQDQEGLGGIAENFYVPERGSHLIYSYTDDNADTALLERIISTFKFTNITQSKNGVVQGKVSIGPICPVEREGVPCEINPEVYTSRKVFIYKPDQKTVIAEKNLSPNGSYEFSLPAGEYYVNVIPQGIGILPSKKIVVVENKTSQLDFDIDTGIR